MAIDITNKEEKQIALTGTQIEETLLQAHLSKDAIANIEGMSTTGEQIDGVLQEGKNLYNPKYNTLGVYILNTTGATLSNSEYATSDFIKVTPLEIYNFSLLGKFITYWDENKNFISGLKNFFTVTIPDNVAYIRFSCVVASMNGLMQFEKGSKTVYEAYTKDLIVNKIVGLGEKVVEINITNDFKQSKVIGENLYNPYTSVLNERVVPNVGTFTTTIDYMRSDFIEIEPNENYICKTTLFTAFYDDAKNFISSPANSQLSWITPSNSKYVVISSGKTQMDFNAKNQLVKGTELPTFKYYQKAIPYSDIQVEKEPTIITASIDNIEADFVGRRAIQDALDSIVDAEPTNRYLIDVWEGVYSATELAHFDNNDKCFIQAKDYVDVVARSKSNTFIYGELPDNLGVNFLYGNYSPVYWRATDCYLKNFTVIAKNCRYPIHNDNAPSDSTQNIINCDIIHYGNYNDATVSTSWNPIGLGTKSGQVFTVEDSTLDYVSIHNNIDFEKPSTVTFRNCTIKGRPDEKTFSEIISLGSLGSGLKCDFILEKCDVAKGIPIKLSGSNNKSTTLSSINADVNEINLIMKDNKPLAINNNSYIQGGLCIKSKTSDSNSKVRFDETSTAFEYIISNNLHNVVLENGSLRNVVNGYEYFDGGNTLSGFTVGSLGVSSQTAFASLGKRLGDCSVVSKTLTVVINGNTYNIIFNTNLTNETNDNILSLINSVISSDGVASIYVIAKDYYPAFKGNTIKTNADSTHILAGMGIVFVGVGTIRKATNADGRIDGIALDNCIVGGKTRVITCGEIHTRSSGQRFTIQQSANTPTTFGSKLGISTTSGIFEINATPTLLSGVGTNIVEII